IRRPACARTASTTAGWQCPIWATEIPARKSRYSLPSSSHRRVPSPRTNSTGFRAYVDISASRSSDWSSERATARAPSASRPQLGADALVGEQLEQERVGLASVEDVGRADSS